MNRKQLPSAEYLRQCFDYNQNCGALIWKPRPRSHFKTDTAHKIVNARLAGKSAGMLTKHGYLQVGIDRQTFFSHRIIFTIVHGYCPDYIDHINGDRSDNSITNLREVTHAQNLQNTKLPSDNTSGVIGVYFSATRGKWCAQIKVNGKRLTLGRFDNKSDAVLARKNAEIECGYHKNHGVREGRRL
jgi:hypothetical protein